MNVRFMQELRNAMFLIAFAFTASLEACSAISRVFIFLCDPTNVNLRKIIIDSFILSECSCN